MGFVLGPAIAEAMMTVEMRDDRSVIDEVELGRTKSQDLAPNSVGVIALLSVHRPYIASLSAQLI